MVPTPSSDTLIAAYYREAADLVALYDSADPAVLYAPVATLLPTQPARIADIGAGTGRDAAWLAGQGHDVVAVEPATGLREHGRARLAGRSVTWLDDRLPHLPHLTARAEQFDAILLNGVWHHMSAADRAVAMRTLATLLAPSGILLIRARAGPTAPTRPGYDLPLADTLATARDLPLEVIAYLQVESYFPAKRAAGVSWTWLAFRRG